MDNGYRALAEPIDMRELLELRDLHTPGFKDQPVRVRIVDPAGAIDMYIHSDYTVTIVPEWLKPVKSGGKIVGIQEEEK